jgi:transcription elongation GreA/GreB family factor
MTNQATTDEEKLILKQAIINAFLSRKEKELQAMMNTQMEEIDEAHVGESESHNLIEDGKTDQVMRRVELRSDAADGLKSDVDSLTAMNYDKTFEKVQMGAVIATDQGHFFYGIASTEVEVDGESYTGIAPDSPVGQEMKGKQIGDIVHFGQISYTIHDVY